MYRSRSYYPTQQPKNPALIWNECDVTQGPLIAQTQRLMEISEVKQFQMKPYNWKFDFFCWAFKQPLFCYKFEFPPFLQRLS